MIQWIPNEMALMPLSLQSVTGIWYDVTRVCRTHGQMKDAMLLSGRFVVQNLLQVLSVEPLEDI